MTKTAPESQMMPNNQIGSENLNSPDRNLRSKTGAIRWGLYLPFGALVLICLAWSGFWYYASSRTNSVMDAALVKEARLGRDWTCPGRTVSGFPFRIEVKCDAPSFVSRMEGRDGSGSLAGLRVEARAVDPTRAIATLVGPLMIKTPMMTIEVNWNDAKTLLTAGSATLRDFSLDIQGATLSLVQANQAPVLGGAKRVNLNIAQEGDVIDGAAQFKLLARIDGLTFAPLDALTGNSQPLQIEWQMIASKVPVMIQPDWRLMLDAWRQSGGTAKLVLLDLSKSPARLQGMGDLALDDARRPTGKLEVSFQGLDKLSGRLGLGAVGGMIKNGKLPLILAKGKAYLGPIPFAELLPLY